MQSWHPHAISLRMVEPTLFQFRRSGIIRLLLLVLGSTLMIIAPIVGAIPGPGGLIVFAIGLGLALRNSVWIKRRYVNFKQRFPTQAGWADRGLGRKKRMQKTSPDD